MSNSFKDQESNQFQAAIQILSRWLSSPKGQETIQQAEEKTKEKQEELSRETQTNSNLLQKRITI